MKRLSRVAVLVGLALVISGCGAKKESAAAPTGAELAPSSAPAYVSVTTDPASAQWKAADRLLQRFPGSGKLLSSALGNLSGAGLDWKRDVKPALPPELNVVWLDFANGGRNVVAYAKPTNKAKFDELLESGSHPLVHRTIDGWTVFAAKAVLLDRFEQARAGSDPLSQVDSFREGIEALPEDAALRGWVSGKAIQESVRRQAPGGQQFRGFTQGFGQVEYLTLSAAAQERGLKLEAVYRSTQKAKLEQFTPELDAAVPAGALVYVSFGDLSEYLGAAADSADKSLPGFGGQRDQLEKALGFSLKDDLFPLFSKEVAVAVYRSAKSSPNVLLVLRVDEGKAKRVLDRLTALAALGGGKATTWTLRGVSATRVTFENSGFSIFAVVTGGKAYVTTTEETLDGALGDGPKLSDDAAYASARAAAGVPDETMGFAYANLSSALPYLFALSEKSQPGSISREARANTKPLDSAFLSATKDGDRVKLSGFVAIK